MSRTKTNDRKLWNSYPNVKISTRNTNTHTHTQRERERFNMSQLNHYFVWNLEYTVSWLSSSYGQFPRGFVISVFFHYYRVLSRSIWYDDDVCEIKTMHWSVMCEKCVQKWDAKCRTNNAWILWRFRWHIVSFYEVFVWLSSSPYTVHRDVVPHLHQVFWSLASVPIVLRGP
jgi:hypothetical protein